MMSLPPPAEMLRILTSRWVSSAISVAAQLNVAAELADGPRSIEDLAKAVGANPVALHRVLRALASVGIFAEDEGGRFTNTPVSETLKDGPGSMRGMALLLASTPLQVAWMEMLHSVRTGEPAFEKAHGMKAFDYLDRDPQFADVFSAGMTSRSSMEVGAVMFSYDFSKFETIVDVGGGQGKLLATLLARAPNQRGVLFDLPVVIANAKALLDQAGVTSRCEIIGGDFFKTPPPAADAYLMKHVLHDWDDENAIKILRNVRAAAPPHARLFVLESVIPPGNEPYFGKILDLQMLVFTHGGRERTRQEWEKLLAAGGFKLQQIAPTPAPLCVIEAAPV